MPRRSLRSFDLLFAVLFVMVAALVGVQSRREALASAPAVVLPRETARLDRVAEAKRGIELIPPPGTPEEASALLVQFDAWLACDREAGWDDFGAWIAKRGKEGVPAGFDAAWGAYRAAAGDLRGFLQSLAAARQAPEPGVELKQTDRYMVLHNRLQDAEDALDGWVARLSPGDFR